MNYQIPENEISNFISVYWQMLREIEAANDPLNKHLVKGAYGLLNRCNITDVQPQYK